jgi:hypothetical protein
MDNEAQSDDGENESKAWPSAHPAAEFNGIEVGLSADEYRRLFGQAYSAGHQAGYAQGYADGQRADEE